MNKKLLLTIATITSFTFSMIGAARAATYCIYDFSGYMKGSATGGGLNLTGYQGIDFYKNSSVITSDEIYRDAESLNEHYTYTITCADGETKGAESISQSGTNAENAAISVGGGNLNVSTATPTTLMEQLRLR